MLNCKKMIKSNTCFLCSILEWIIPRFFSIYPVPSDVLFVFIELFLYLIFLKPVSSFLLLSLSLSSIFDLFINAQIVQSYSHCSVCEL